MEFASSARNSSGKFGTLLLTAALTGAVLLLAGRSEAQCALNPVSPSVTICSPANGVTVTSPVSVVAGTTDTAHPVTAMKVYVDNVAVYTVQASQLSTSLSMSGGQHNITVNAWDSSGAVFKSTVIITVSGTGTAAVSVAISPHSGTLAPGQTQQFTSTVLNSTNTAVNWSVDGFALGNTTVGMITTGGLYTAGTALGNHTVVATSVADPTKSDSAIMTVTTAATGGGNCTPNAPAPSLTICSPVAGSTVTSPVNVQAVAASNAAVTKFLVYVDNTLVYQASNTSSINTNITLSTGNHFLVAQYYNGAWVKQSETITVATSAVVSVSITPTSATVAASGTQQFTASVQNTPNTGVTWTATGGTIAGTGNTVTYTAPATAGSFTVTATSVADTSKSASASVTVGSTSGSFPSSNHVFLIMEENQSFSAVFPSGSATNCSSSGMPYVCSLAAANGMALNFYSNQHDSLLAYLYSTSGATWTGSPYNCNGLSCASIGAITGDNMARAIVAAGKTWRGYFEGMPSQGYMGGDTNNYVLHHNPFPWYSDVANSVSQQDNMYPFTQLVNDVNNNTLPNFGFIVPNALHDADGTGTQTSSALLSAADTWIQNNIAPLLSSAPFKPGGDGILIITFDEGSVAGKSGDSSTDSACSPTQSSGCGGHVAFVMIGPNVKPASVTTNAYHFQDMLHTIIHLLGMTDYMNAAGSGVDINLLPGVP